MTNYKQFYNAWQGFAKPKRQLLLERVELPVKFYVGDYLRLTTNSELLNAIKDDIFAKKRIKGDFDPKEAGEIQLSVDLDDTGNAQVVYHEGRHRALALKIAKMKEGLSGTIQDLAAIMTNLGIPQEQISDEIDRVFIYGQSETLSKAFDNMSTSNEKKRKLKAETEKKLKHILHLIDGEAKMVDRSAQINGVLRIANKENVGFMDIKKFIGEFDKSVVVPRHDLVSIRPVVKNIDNPLQLTEPVSIVGYQYYPQGEYEEKGIIPYLSKVYHNDSALQQGGYPGYAKLLDNVYTVTDSEGKQYNISYGPRVDFHRADERDPSLRNKRYGGTLNLLKLEPQPYIEYSKNRDDPDYTGKDKANSLTYTIKKKA
jgi:hypothetical protein